MQSDNDEEEGGFEYHLALDGEIAHIDDESCWCRPDRIFVADNANEVWAHKGPGDLMIPSKLIAFLIATAIADRKECGIDRDDEDAGQGADDDA